MVRHISGSATLTRPALALVVALALVAVWMPRGMASAPVTPLDPGALVVCPTCEVTSLSDAVSQAPAGSRIEVHGGSYPGGLVIERDLTIAGVNRPVIDGGGQGTLVTIRGATVTLSGFQLRGSGISLNNEDAAILSESSQVTLEDNRIEDALFGLYLKDSHGSVLRGNVITSMNLPVARRGDSVRVWYSHDTLIENNIAQHGRDVILWYSDRGTVRDNNFDFSRYGLHLMFSHHTTVTGNSLNGNSIGLYAMYSNDLTVSGNSLSNNHGPSGGGLGLKDVNGARIEGNRFVHNQIAAQVDGSPLNPGITHHWVENVFAYNEIGLGIQPAVLDNLFVGNAFIDNIQHVTITGGRSLPHVRWNADGSGNYWSDYAGYDANGDGIGDIPYRSEQLFEALIDKHPALRLFLFSPAAMSIDFAARAFPAVRPQTRFEDTAPLTKPPASVTLPAAAQASPGTRVASAALGSIAVLGATVLSLRLRRASGQAAIESKEEEMVVAPLSHDSGVRHVAPSAAPDERIVEIRDLTKRYASATALDGVSFDIARGETIALWGPNGAGKTTILRCLLGVARYDGTVRVNGIDPTRDGRAARRMIGYVPQDLAPSAMTVGEMAVFIARLKRSDMDDATERLRMLGIADQLGKPVAALSGGMKQRLALALALIGAPEMLLLDEPTANLDAAGRADLHALLRNLKRGGMTLIFSSHQPDEVATLADRVLLLKQGVLEQIVSAEQFTQSALGDQRLVVTLRNGHRDIAIDTLRRLGLHVVGTERVLTVTLKSQQKADILSALVREGVEIDDFTIEQERGTAWSGRA
jgi:nitrous oxidase accessory protein